MNSRLIVFLPIELSLNLMPGLANLSKEGKHLLQEPSVQWLLFSGESLGQDYQVVSYSNYKRNSIDKVYISSIRFSPYCFLNDQEFSEISQKARKAEVQMNSSSIQHAVKTVNVLFI